MNPRLEIGQHGTYHANNTPLGEWATLTDRNFFSCEACGFDTQAVFVACDSIETVPENGGRNGRR